MTATKEDRAIVRDHRNLATLKAELREGKAKLRALARKVERLEERVERADRVHLIHDGVPMEKGHGVGPHTLYPIALENERRAKIYLNAHNRKTYGLQLTDYNQEMFHGREKFCGAGWPSYEEALEAGKNYVAHGIVPERRG